MRDLSSTLKEVYNATSVAIIPGSGSYGMEVSHLFGCSLFVSRLQPRIRPYLL